MHIDRSVVDVSERVRGVLRGINAAVFCIALFREGLSKGGIEELEDLAGLTQWLEQYIGHEERVDCEATEKDTPEDRVRTLYQCVWELNTGKSQETHH